MNSMHNPSKRILFFVCIFNFLSNICSIFHFHDSIFFLSYCSAWNFIYLLCRSSISRITIQSVLALIKNSRIWTKIKCYQLNNKHHQQYETKRTIYPKKILSFIYWNKLARNYFSSYINITQNIFYFKIFLFEWLTRDFSHRRYRAKSFYYFQQKKHIESGILS